jgi:hypothetical protein
MYQCGGDFWLHLASTAAMLAALCLGLVVPQRRLIRRAAADALHLKAMLETELRHLLALYGENLRLIAAGEDYLMSGRALATVYRGNLGRLGLLDAATAAAIIAAFAHNETIESLLSARTKPIGNAAYRVDPNAAALQEIKRKYSCACHTVRAALDLLQGSTALPRRPATAAAARGGSAAAATLVPAAR